MQLRLYLDEDASSRSLVRGLRARGVEVLAAVEAGKRRFSLKFAAVMQHPICRGGDGLVIVLVHLRQ